MSTKHQSFTQPGLKRRLRLTRASLILVITTQWLYNPWQPIQARAQTAVCDKLGAAQKALALKLLKSQFAYACCDQSLHACLKQQPRCPLVVRLSNNICRRIQKGQDEQKIKFGLSRRARSMLPSPKKAQIKEDPSMSIGNPKAKVTLVVYGCGRCPLCSHLIPKIVADIKDGALSGKTKLVFRPFPGRSHQLAKEMGLAYLAAAKMGKFWEYMQLSFDHFRSIDADKIIQIARDLNLSQIEFEKHMRDPTTRAMLLESKKEGLRNHVRSTPTFFINQRLYLGDLDEEELIDVLEEEYDNLSKPRDPSTP